MQRANRPDPIRVRFSATPLFVVAWAIFATWMFSAPAQEPDLADIVVADFEGEDFGQWQVEGEAFGQAPAQGTLPGQMHVGGFEGKGLANSFNQGDDSVGTLTSPSFVIERRFVTFLIGGGGQPGKTCINLLVGGEAVRSATGGNTQSGGSEELNLASWDVSEFVGKQATIRIVDTATGGWGHINVDHIVLTDTKPPVPIFDRREKTFTIQDRYLVMPIQNGGSPNGRLQLFVNDREVRNYELRIASSAEATDWYAFFTLDRYQGEHARVVASQATEEGFSLVRQSSSVPGDEQVYREPHRPQFHFTQKVGWNNDPNGMVYHDGKWHFFFQHNPVALPWGNMTWGHAISPDLVHWEQQPNKLFPKTMARGDCFSGGATVDKNNTAGWGANALVAFLTDTGAGESIAYSTDGGHSFVWYEGNPVVKHQGRDPKVIWYPYEDDDQPLNDRARQLGGHWVMVVYDENQEYGQNVAIYTSTNLKEWTERSHLTGYFECPEMFELPIDEIGANRRWVLFAADAKYAVGKFNGTTFRPEHEGKHQVHWGPYYASQTFDNSPDGRRIQIGWLRIDSPGPYNQHFSLPHRLTLRSTDDGIRMFAQPVKEVEQLRLRSHRYEGRPLVADQTVKLAVSSDLLDVQVRVDVGSATEISLALPGRTIRYDASTRKLNDVPLEPVDGRISIRVLADRSITEIIGNEGRVYISGGGPAQTEATDVVVTAHGGDAKLDEFQAHELKSIW
ncbi:MAG: glycoside hydrolase family 32 protein [Planctomycetales bacterium]|nr:glycoside hydrolase family 32 protein [Planctomycetales bacterium]